MEVREETVAHDAETLGGEIYKCPNCGNFLYYDPESGKMKCDYCGTKEDIQEVGSAVELPYHDSVEQGFVKWDGVKSVKCKSCGAISLLPNYETVSQCPFCNASNIVDVDDIQGLCPNGVLPFRISKDKVPFLYQNWLKSKTLAPNKLKKNAKRQPARGIYIPLFTFDSNVECDYVIRYGKYYTVTVGSGKNRRTETRTRWYTASGYIENFFNDVQIEASKSITQKNLSKLGGFDTDNSLDYHNQFISGYSAERYDKGLDESWQDAKDLIKKSLRQSIVSRYNADVVDYVNMNCGFYDKTYKYILAPIWIFSYKYAKKTYDCIVNGRSGRIVGKYPKSPVKIGAIALTCAAIVGVMIWLIVKYMV